MWRSIVCVALSVVLAVIVWPFSNAQAQATRTWVSGVGDDANPCSRTAPCKTFAGAISKTAARGEISALDPSSEDESIAGWGGLTEYSSRFGDAVRKAVIEAGA